MPAQNLRIVLVETTHPGNIGASARAMKTMGLERLYLVQPHFFPHPEAEARSSGAGDILRNAVVCTSLPEAIAGCALVIGASARKRRIAWPQVDPRQCGELAMRESAAGDVAVVFGREHSGLSNDELDLCNYLVHIPSNPEYSSLNLASAVQVISYELLMARQGQAEPPPLSESPPADAREMELFHEHLERALVAVEFLDPSNPRLLMRHLRRLFGRVRLEKMELNILRGICHAMEQTARKGRTPGKP